MNGFAVGAVSQFSSTCCLSSAETRNFVLVILNVVILYFCLYEYGSCMRFAITLLVHLRSKSWFVLAAVASLGMLLHVLHPSSGELTHAAF